MAKQRKIGAMTDLSAYKDRIAYTLLLISLLLLCDVKVAGVGIYTVVLLLFAVVSLFLHIINEDFEIIALIKKRDEMVCLSAAIVVWEVLRLIYSAVQNATSEASGIERELDIIAVIILFIVYGRGIRISRQLVDIMIIAGIVTSATALAYHVIAADFLHKVIPIITRKNTWTAYLIMLVMLADSRLKDRTVCKAMKGVYIAATALSYVLLVLSGDWLGVGILIGYFLMQPVLMLPTKRLVTISGRQLFALLFTVSNMSLITGYTEVFKIKVDLPLEVSIYVDIILAVCGLVFFTYWEKVPEKADPDRLILKKMRTGFKIAALAYLCTIVAIMFGADRLIIPTDYDMGGIKMVLSIVAASMKNRGNIMTAMVTNGDVIGLILIILIVSIMIYKATKNVSFFKPQTSSYALIAFAFVALLLTTEVNANVAVIGGFLLMTAAYGQEPRQKYKIRRFKFDTDVEQNNRLEEQNELSIEQN